jgi:hypothetical protein
MDKQVAKMPKEVTIRPCCHDGDDKIVAYLIMYKVNDSNKCADVCVPGKLEEWVRKAFEDMEE